MSDTKIKTVADLVAAAGIAKSTVYLWKKLPEYPAGASLDDQLVWCKAKISGAQTDVQADDEKSGTDWATEKKKWDALKSKLGFQQERDRVIMSARSELLSGIEEVLTTMRRKVDEIVHDHPDIARRLNEAYAEALAELKQSED